jgi:N-acetylglucosamine kinase-like BadF-type ATPase
MSRAKDLLVGVDVGGTSVRLIVDGQSQVLALSKNNPRFP